MCKILGHKYVLVSRKDTVSGFKIILVCTKCGNIITENLPPR